MTLTNIQGAALTIRATLRDTDIAKAVMYALEQGPGVDVNEDPRAADEPATLNTGQGAAS